MAQDASLSLLSPSPLSPSLPIPPAYGFLQQATSQFTFPLPNSDQGVSHDDDPLADFNPFTQQYLPDAVIAEFLPGYDWTEFGDDVIEQFLPADEEAPPVAASPVRDEVAYRELLESTPPPAPEVSSPFHFFHAGSPVSGTGRSPSVESTGSRIRAEHGSEMLAAKGAASSDCRSFLAHPGGDDGQQHGVQEETGEPEPQQEAQVRQEDTGAPQSPRRSPTPCTESTIPAAERENEPCARSPYTDEQLNASDEYAKGKFKAPANVEVGSAAYLKAIREAFPFYKTGISRKDRKTGHYTLDADGLPAPHNSIVKADGITKRKTAHQAQQNNATCDPGRWYDEWRYRPASWGPNNLFTYLEDAQLAYRKYKTEEIRLYLEQCPRRYALWVQMDPPQSSHRRLRRDGKPSKEDSKCRWIGCPNNGNKVSGMYRVAFDEFPAQTSQGIKDPYKVAMVMHLWCFEQIVDPVVYHNRGLLFADTRLFTTPIPPQAPNARAPERDPENLGVAEKKNNFSMRNDDKEEAGLTKQVVEAFNPWFEGTAPTERRPRVHHESLAYALTKWRLTHESPCKQRQRQRRKERQNAEQTAGRQREQTPEEEGERYKGKTWPEHLGSLVGYKRAFNEKPAAGKKGNLGGNRNGPRPQEGETGGNVAGAETADVERSPKRQRTAEAE